MKKAGMRYHSPFGSCQSEPINQRYFSNCPQMSLIRMLRSSQKEVVLLINELRKKKGIFFDSEIGRTELQDAVPITLGMEFSAWAEAISRDRQRLEKLKSTSGKLTWEVLL